MKHLHGSEVWSERWCPCERSALVMAFFFSLFYYLPLLSNWAFHPALNYECVTRRQVIERKKTICAELIRIQVFWRMCNYKATAYTVISNSKWNNLRIEMNFFLLLSSCAVFSYAFVYEFKLDGLQSNHGQIGWWITVWPIYNWLLKKKPSFVRH